MNVIQEFIDEDREFREQLRRIRKDEIKQLEDVVTIRFEKEAQVSFTYIESSFGVSEQLVSFVDEARN